MGVAAAVGVTLGLVLITTTVAPGPSLELAARDGAVSTTGHRFPTSATVVVSAWLDGGSASAWMTTTSGGGFEVAFRPPAGFAGEFHVSAVAGTVRAEATIDVASTPPPDSQPPPRASDDGDPDAAGSALTVVPTTGAPSARTIVPAESGLPAYEVPADIRADCSTDVTAAMNDWLASVPDNSQINFGPAACYRVNDSLMLSDRNNLVIEGNGATFQAERRAPERSNRAQWFLQYGGDITLRNMTLVGVNPEARFDVDHEWDHNLFIRGTHTVTVENVHGRNAYGDFIAIAQGADNVTIPSDITIRNVSADTIGRMGISCVACDGVSVDNSVFNNIAFHVFDLEIQGDDWPGRHVSYTGNTVGSHGWAFFSVGTPYQTHDNDLSDVRIVGNTMTMPGSREDNCLPAVSFRSSKIHARDVTITDNRLISHNDAIFVRRASDITIRDNTAELATPTCGDPVGVRMADVSEVDVGGNSLIGYRRAEEVE